MSRAILILLLAGTASADDQWMREARDAARQQQIEEALAEPDGAAWAWVHECRDRVCVSREQLCRMQPCTKP